MALPPDPDQPVIEITNLCHSFGTKEIYRDLNLRIEPGTVFGLLGKNGVGKSTLINILMGYLQPVSGQCMVFGEPSHNLSPNIRQRIALLYEGFTTYDYMSIVQIERFFASFYSKWKKNIFFDLISLLDVQLEQKISSLSFGQKSQVILGLLFAQDADLLLLDDYSMGLDAGYRHLFVDYLKTYLENTKKTVLMTSHVMSDLEMLIGQIAIIDNTTKIYKGSMDNFCSRFRCYETLDNISKSPKIHRIEKQKDKKLLFSFFSLEELQKELKIRLTEVPVTFAERFLGYVGKY